MFVTGVQTCALPIFLKTPPARPAPPASIPRPRVLLKKAPASHAAQASIPRPRVLLKKAPASPAAQASTSTQRAHQVHRRAWIAEPEGTLMPRA